MTSPDDRLTLPVSWPWLAAVPAALVALLLLAARIDDRRRDAQLAAMVERSCRITFPEALIRDLEAVIAEPAAEPKRARLLAQCVQSRFPRGDSVEILFERDGQVHTVSAHQGPTAWHDDALRRAAGDWAGLTAGPRCRGLRLEDPGGHAYDRSFAVVLNYRLGGETPVVVVSRQRMAP